MTLRGTSPGAHLTNRFDLPNTASKSFSQLEMESRNSFSDIEDCCISFACSGPLLPVIIASRVNLSQSAR
ncbi:hypothetical protein TNCV_382781 [Trichonephila clavipes]|nr:hypothetical protein TNCV_382781 [Trichonephila clavipes]